MTMLRLASLALAASIAALLTGCAGVDTQPSAEARPQKVYRTGSNLPVKDDDGSVVSVRPDALQPILGAPGASPRQGM
jgi:ABC-type uncharacterized transport system auxiliary subunit